MIFDKLFKRQPKQIKPNYFLFTSTAYRDFEFKNTFENNDKLENARQAINDLGRTALFSNQQYATKTVDGVVIHLFAFFDKRIDRVGRKIFSYFGVLVDENDRTFDADAFIKEVSQKIKRLNKTTYTIFDLANEFSINWKENYNHNDEITC